MTAALVQKTPVVSGTGTQATFPNPTAPDNTVIVITGCNNGSLYTTAAIGDSGGSNTYTQQVVGFVNAGTTFGRSICILSSLTVSSITYVFDATGAGNDWIAAEEWSGLTGVVLAANTANDPSGTSGLPSVSLTTSASALVVGAGASNGSLVASGSGYTLDLSGNPGGGFQGIAESANPVAAGTFNVTGGTSVPDWIISAVAFALTPPPQLGRSPAMMLVT